MACAGAVWCLLAEGGGGEHGGDMAAAPLDGHRAPHQEEEAEVGLALLDYGLARHCKRWSEPLHHSSK